MYLEEGGQPGHLPGWLEALGESRILCTVSVISIRPSPSASSPPSRWPGCPPSSRTCSARSCPCPSRPRRRSSCTGCTRSCHALRLYSTRFYNYTIINHIVLFLYTVYCILYCILYTVYCICILYTVYCILYTVICNL